MVDSSQDFVEEWTRRCQNYFVRLKLLAIFAGKGDINKVVVIPKAAKRVFDIFFKVIPFETKSFNHFASCLGWMDEELLDILGNIVYNLQIQVN